MARSPRKAVLSIAGATLVFIAAFALQQLSVRFPEVKKMMDQMASSTAPEPGPTALTTSSTDDIWFTVKRAIDGDTIELADGTDVRYIGVNTPETHHPTKGVQCYGKEAAAFNESLVAGKRVRLEKDVSETDRYGRLLRFVYLEDGTFVNKALLEKGYAEVMTYPPDVARSKEFLALQALARDARVGLWGFCSSTVF